jgi:prepilin-type N-terminal cleavage/methylation domain-containing protein
MQKDSLRFRKRKGFSLVELVVTIAIIGILSAIILVGVSDQKEQKDVESAATFLTAKLREIQTAALTGRQYTTGTTPCAYRGTWSGTALTTSYMYKDTSGDCTLITTISTFTLPGGVSADASGTVDFVLPHAKIASDITITLEKGAASESVCIGEDGLIESGGSC